MYIKKLALYLIIFFAISYMGANLNLSVASSDIERDDIESGSSHTTKSSSTHKKTKISHKKNRGSSTDEEQDPPHITIEVSPERKKGRNLRMARNDIMRGEELAMEEGELASAFQPSILPTQTGANADDDEDLLEDVPGCEDNYYRCCLCCFRVSRGWIDALVAVTLIGGAITTTLVTNAHFESSTNIILGNVTAGFLAAGAALKIAKAFIIDATISRTNDLRTVVSQARIHREHQQNQRQQSQRENAV